MKLFAAWGLGFLLLAGCCCPRPCCPTRVAVATPAPEAVMPPVADEAPAAEAADATAYVLSVLESKRLKGLDWNEVDLDTVAAYLRTVTGIEFVLSPGASESEAITTLALDDVSIRTVLDIVTASFELHWKVENGGVLIFDSGERKLATRLRYFDVKDMATDRQAASLLVHTIRTRIAEGTWSEAGRSLEARNGILIARAPADVLDEISQLLDGLRTDGAGSDHLVVQIHHVADLVAETDTTVEALADSIRSDLGPRQEFDAPLTIKAQGESLVVKASRATQDRVGAYLTGVRAKSANARRAN